MHVYNLAGRKAGDSQVYLLAIASSIILYRDLEHLRSQVAWRAHQVCSSTTPHSTSHITVSTSHSTHHTVIHHTVTQYRSHCHTAHVTHHTVTQRMSRCHTAHITLSHSTHTDPINTQLLVTVSPSFSLIENPKSDTYRSRFSSRRMLSGYRMGRGRKRGRMVER